MRKTLLATTALAAATGMAVIASPASAAERLSVSIGGYFQAYYGIFDQEKNRARTINDGAGNPTATSYRNHDFFREGEIHFKGEVALDNGMKVGLDVQLEAETCGDQIDESYLYFQGDFGKVVLGSENSAAYLMSYGAPAADANFDGADPNYAFSGLSHTFGNSTLPYAPNMTSDSEKITYFTPRFAGFGFGVSFTPDNTEDQDSSLVNAVDNDGRDFRGIGARNAQGEVVELGLNYEQKFDGFGVLAGLTYGFANDLETEDSDAKKAKELSAGLNLTFGGFTVGGGYWWHNGGASGDADVRAYTGGVAWANGPLRLAASYMDYKIGADSVGGTFAVTNAGDDAKIDRYAVGASYVYAPGMQLRASVLYYDWKGPDDDILAGLIGTVINF